MFVANGSWTNFQVGDLVGDAIIVENIIDRWYERFKTDAVVEIVSCKRTRIKHLVFRPRVEVDEEVAFVINVDILYNPCRDTADTAQIVTNVRKQILGQRDGAVQGICDDGHTTEVFAKNVL